jgi:hypothetical protein
MTHSCLIFLIEPFVSQPPIQLPPSTPQNKKRRTTESENANSIEMVALGGSLLIIFHFSHFPGPHHVINGSLRVHGVVRAHGFIQYSDLRLKTNISEITDAINIIGQLSV